MSYRHNRSNGGLFKPGGRASRAMDGRRANSVRRKAGKALNDPYKMFPLEDRELFALASLISRNEDADRVRKVLREKLAAMPREQFFKEYQEMLSEYPTRHRMDTYLPTLASFFDSEAQRRGVMIYVFDRKTVLKKGLDAGFLRSMKNHKEMMSFISNDPGAHIIKVEDFKSFYK